MGGPSYLYLKEIRRQEVEKLKEAHRYKEALQLLDEGIRIAREKEEKMRETSWSKMKLEIYELQGDIASAIPLCRQCFIKCNGGVDYYYRLKSMVKSSERKAFLEDMLKEINLSVGWWNTTVSDIYMEEKDYDKLFECISTCMHSRLDLLSRYAYKLPQSFAGRLLPLFVADLKAYAEGYADRTHYRYIAQTLRDMKLLKGGKEAVQTLVEEFKDLYKRRPAMMDELKGI